MGRLTLLMQMLRMFISALLAVVTLITSVGNVVLVECWSEGQQAVELAGHAKHAHGHVHQALADHDEDDRCCGHAHGHDECSDQPLLDPAICQRNDPVEQTSVVDAADGPIVSESCAWLSDPFNDRRYQPQLCPRPPPRAPQAADAFLAIRLLI